MLVEKSEMLEKKDLNVGKLYSCKITADYALSQNKPDWIGKTAILRFTGMWLRSIKDSDRIFCYKEDAEPIEEVDRHDIDNK